MRSTGLCAPPGPRAGAEPRAPRLFRASASRAPRAAARAGVGHGASHPAVGAVAGFSLAALARGTRLPRARRTAVASADLDVGEKVDQDTNEEVPGIKAFYTFPPAPAALIVDVFLREKGISPECIQSIQQFVDLPALENRGETCKKMNPQGSIPWFVTSDGKVVAETIAMCEYAEEQMPTPPLVGASASERGVTRMWQRRMEEHFCSPATYAHRNWCHSQDCPEDHGMKNFYTNRFNAEQGSNLLYEHPGAWKDLATWARNRIAWLEQVKQDEAKAEGKAAPSEFICGDSLTMVDIQVYVNVFYWDTFCPGQHYFKELEGKIPWVKAWYDRMHARPAVAAARTAAGYKDFADKSDMKE